MKHIFLNLKRFDVPAEYPTGLDLPPSDSPSRTFCTLCRPQAIPLLPFELNA